MDILNLHKKSNVKPATGKLLIAEPFLRDPGFARAVILLCEHGQDGTIGFILNRPSEGDVNTLFPGDTLPALSVYAGGPVQTDTLHIVHRMPDLEGGHEILPGVFWGGTYRQLSALDAPAPGQVEQVRLFKGYAGWDAGQLEEELEQGYWIVAHARKEIIFETDTAYIWAHSLRSLGHDFAYLANFPLHPQMN